MGEILQYLLTGLSLGGIYALVALGFYIMWEATKAANFTHGDVYMFGAVITVVLVERGIAAAGRRAARDRRPPPRSAP